MKTPTLEMFKRKVTTIIKTIALTCFFILLNGCASYVASEITRPKAFNMKGNIPDWAVEKKLCDSELHCVNTIALKDNSKADENLKLTFDFHFNDNHKIWHYQTKEDSVEVIKPLSNQLIVLFAGYGQATQLLYLHQKWLQHITGANVIVVSSADKSQRFQFGLDYTLPLITEIQRLKPKKVHLVGFSMGALAATAIEKEVKNARLYLFAPMTDFEYSTKAIYDIQYKDTFYSKLVSENTLENAIQIIYEKSGVTPKDTDLLAKLNTVKSPTFIYASSKDRVVDYSVLNSIENEIVDVSVIDGLNHIEMVALMKRELLAEFISDLLERPVTANATDVLGTLCDFDDEQCLKSVAR